MNMNEVPARYVVGETQRKYKPHKRNRKEQVSDHEILAAMPGTISEISKKAQLSRSRTYIRVRNLHEAGTVHIVGLADHTSPYQRDTPVYAVGEREEAPARAPQGIPQQDPLMLALFGGRK